MSKHVIVIGAGLGGMTCAARLAHAGYQVTVIEKNSHTGGKMDFWQAEGFKWDLGPSVLTMPFILRHLFNDLGHDCDDYLEIMKIDPTCRYFFADGNSMHTWSDRNKMTIEIARREGDHGERFDKFWKYSKAIYELSADTFLFNLPKRCSDLWTWKNIKNLHHLPKIITPTTIARKVQHFFKSPLIRQFFNRFATYTGSSPYKTPATFNIIAYTEMAFGTWFIKGGMYRIATALERLCRENKVEFMLDSEVEEILVNSEKQAEGVKIKGKSELKADAIVVNGDVIDTWINLLKYRGKKSMEKKMTHRPLSSSGFVILLGIDHSYPKLEHHNVFFSKNYREEFDDIFKRKIPPQDPTIYVTASVRSDPTLAPKEKDNLFILVNTPPIQPDFNWVDEKEKYADHIIKSLELRGLSDLSKHITYRRVISPLEFSDKYFAHRGAIYGHSYHSLLSIFQRPKNRSNRVKGLYFASGSVRPGGGIPLVLLSGKNASECVQQDFPLS